MLPESGRGAAASSGSLMNNLPDSLKEQLSSAAVEHIKSEGARLLETGRSLLTSWQAGHWGLQGLCFVGGFALFSTSVLGLINILNTLALLFNPPKLLIEIYLIVFGFVTMALEAPPLKFAFLTRPLDRLKAAIHTWCKILTLLSGRGCFYIFQGTLACAQWTFVNFVLGAYMFFVGAACLATAYSTKQKMSDVKVQMKNLGGEGDELMLKSKFDEFDADGTGTINTKELGALVNSFGVSLSRDELALAMERLDSNKSGWIEYNEFAAWFKASDFNQFV